MAKEDFIPLLEIQSVEKKLQSLNKIIEQENARFGPLEKLKTKNDQKFQNSTEAIERNKKLQKSTEMDTEGLYKSLNVSETELMNVKTNDALKKMEAEIGRIKKEIENNETKSLELLEEEELLNTSLEEVKTFNKNFPVTYQEIKEDIERDNKTIFNQIQSLEDHLKNLNNQLPEKVKSIYSHLKEKVSNPVTFLENNKCGHCATIQDQSSINATENFIDITQCSTCKRIIVSKSAQY